MERNYDLLIVLNKYNFIVFLRFWLSELSGQNNVFFLVVAHPFDCHLFLRCSNMIDQKIFAAQSEAGTQGKQKIP